MKIKTNEIDIEKIENELNLHFGDDNYTMVFDEYHKQFKKLNPKLFDIPCKILWGVNKFKTLGEFFSEITLSFNYCDGSELAVYFEQFEKIIKMYNNGKINKNNVIVL